MNSLQPYPHLIVDLDVVRRNIKRMSEKAVKAHVKFRPHFKTHQSRYIGRIFKEFDVSGITVSSIKMAHYFADDGWKDITIAFPANVLAADDYNALASKCTLKTLVTSVGMVQKLNQGLKHNISLYIEIDPDYGRSGISATETVAIEQVIEVIETSSHCSFEGFYCHAGHTYKARSKEKITAIAKKALQKLSMLKEIYPDAHICFGDTPSCSILDNFGPADQISPGNFVFYDRMQVEIGSCSVSDIAVKMRCPVIEKFDKRSQILIHGGAVHFSRESILIDGKLSYGQVRGVSDTEATLYSLSQEHGLIDCSKEAYSNYEIGDYVEILPIHSCLTANLMAGYISTNGESIDHMNGI